jgi:hypothetical protein
MQDQNVILICAGALALLLYYVITRWAHEVSKRNRYLEAQIKLLSKIAEKSGVSAEEINVILRVAQS